MADKGEIKKIRVCPNCKTTTGSLAEGKCPVCGANLLSACPSCRAILEDNGDARECKACGMKFKGL